jgi:AcrR family transcriptional regulator
VVEPIHTVAMTDVGARPKPGRPGRTGRLGRPPADGAPGTRQRILHAARRSFAELGYEAATNKTLADGAGLTTGALYHYFGSKLDLYAAVYDEVQTIVYARFDATVAEADAFVGGVDAVLDVAHELNLADPSLARFLGAVRVDVRRTPQLRRAIARPATRRDRFIHNLVDIGVRTGEIAPDDRSKTEAMVLALLIGLVDAVSDSPITHRRAVDAMKALFGGQLIRAQAVERHDGRGGVLDDVDVVHGVHRGP